MGKWIRNQTRLHDNTDGWAAQCLNDAEAELIRVRHNADCDAYGEQIAELRAELAAVKQQSLRVVELSSDHDFTYDWYMAPDGLIGWVGTDKRGDSCVETPEGYHRFEDCKPVRLERWEGESNG